MSDEEVYDVYKKWMPGKSTIEDFSSYLMYEWIIAVGFMFAVGFIIINYVVFDIGIKLVLFGIVIGIVTGIYMCWKHQKRKEFVENRKFLDAILYIGHTKVIEQIILDDFIQLDEFKYLLNNQIILDFVDKKSTDALNFGSGKVVCKYGICDADHLCGIDLVYESEYKLDDKIYPLFIVAYADGYAFKDVDLSMY